MHFTVVNILLALAKNLVGFIAKYADNANDANLFRLGSQSMHGPGIQSRWGTQPPTEKMQNSAKSWNNKTDEKNSKLFRLT